MPKSIDQGDVGLAKFRTIAGSLLESAGRRFGEAISVGPRKIAEVPKSPIHGHVGNGCGTTFSGDRDQGVVLAVSKLRISDRLLL